METSAGILLISVRPFAAVKWSAWLVSNESSLLSGSLPSYTKSATYLTAPLPSSPYREHIKNTWVTKTLCFQYCKKTKQTCRNACTWSSGEYNWWPVSRHEPLDTTGGQPPTKRACLQRLKLGGSVSHSYDTERIITNDKMRKRQSEQ